MKKFEEKNSMRSSKEKKEFVIRLFSGNESKIYRKGDKLNGVSIAEIFGGEEELELYKEIERMNEECGDTEKIEDYDIDDETLSLINEELKRC